MQQAWFRRVRHKVCRLQQAWFRPVRHKVCRMQQDWFRPVRHKVCRMQQAWFRPVRHKVCPLQQAWFRPVRHKVCPLQQAWFRRIRHKVCPLQQAWFRPIREEVCPLQQVWFRPIRYEASGLQRVKAGDAVLSLVPVRLPHASKLFVVSALGNYFFFAVVIVVVRSNITASGPGECFSAQTASLAWWLRRPPRERNVPGSNPACAGFFRGRVIPVTQKLALQWLPCQAPGVIGSALGLVGPVSVYCDWVR